jgi:hypothetical protein
VTFILSGLPGTSTIAASVSASTSSAVPVSGCTSNQKRDRRVYVGKADINIGQVLSSVVCNPHGTQMLELK